MSSRRFIVLAATATFMTMGGGAAAQSQCGDNYTVKPGDTLYRVTQDCGVTLARIMDLNPGLGNPRDIEVGTELRLSPGGGDAGRPVDGDPPGGAPYEVEEGDTMYSIAQALGVSLFELIEANAGIDPFDIEIGQRIEVPGDGPGASVAVRPQDGEPGQPVTVSADGLRPDDWVTVGVGPRSSEWRELDTVRVAPDGEIREQVRVPGWSDPGDVLVFVVDTDRGVTFKSGPFEVRDGERGDDGDMRTLEGRVSQGPECYTLRTPDGDVWSLVSETVPFTAGEYVEVAGERADASFCMQGVGTLSVSQIDEIRPPEDSDES